MLSSISILALRCLPAHTLGIIMFSTGDVYFLSPHVPLFFAPPSFLHLSLFTRDPLHSSSTTKFHFIKVWLNICLPENVFISHAWRIQNWFIQHIFIVGLLCARTHPRHLGHFNEQNPKTSCLWGSYILEDKVGIISKMDKPSVLYVTKWKPTSKRKVEQDKGSQKRLQKSRWSG